MNAESKPALWERTTGTTIECDADGQWATAEATAFCKEWQIDVIFQNMGE